MRILFVGPSHPEAAWLFKALQESAQSLLLPGVALRLLRCWGLLRRRIAPGLCGPARMRVFASLIRLLKCTRGWLHCSGSGARGAPGFFLLRRLLVLLVLLLLLLFCLRLGGLLWMRLLASWYAADGGLP